MSLFKYLCKKAATLASVDEKFLSFLASCQMLHNSTISAINYGYVLYMLALFDE